MKRTMAEKNGKGINSQTYGLAKNLAVFCSPQMAGRRGSRLGSLCFPPTRQKRDLFLFWGLLPAQKRGTRFSFLNSRSGPGRAFAWTAPCRPWSAPSPPCHPGPSLSVCTIRLGSSPWFYVSRFWLLFPERYHVCLFFRLRNF